MPFCLQAQGCSDAGFCTINSFKPSISNSQDSNKIKELPNQIKLGISFGKADHNILILANYLEYNRVLSKKWGIDVKLTSILQSGKTVQVWNLSDIFLNLNYTVLKNLKATFGLKAPLNLANRNYQGQALPMDYQSSLGTIDILAGVGYELKGLQIVAAIQQPISQNKNNFVNTMVNDTSLSSFQSTNKFKRAGDVLLRFSYPFKIGKHLKLTPSLLGIYHFTNDKYTDSSMGQNLQKIIQGSNGLTLNAVGFIDYTINAQHSLQLNGGVPFVVRKVRPDGLTRSFIVSLEYRFKF